MNPTNIKLAVGATLTGLLLVAAGSLTGISTAAADGPEVAMPGAQSVSEVQLPAAAGPADLLQTMKGQPATTYQLANCTSAGQSDQIINPTLTCAAVVVAATPPTASGAGVPLFTVNNAATFNSAQVVTVVSPEPAAIIALPALQAVSSLR